MDRLGSPALTRALADLADAIKPEAERRQHRHLERLISRRGRLKIDQSEGFIPHDVVATVVLDTVGEAFGELPDGILKVASGIVGIATAADVPSGINAALISGGSVSNTEYDYLNGVTSALQTQLDGKMSASAPASPVCQTTSQSTADTANTTSTSVFADAASVSITLGTGTWSLFCIGGLLLSHSAGDATWRLEVNGTGGSTRTLNVLVEKQVIANQNATSITGGGSITVKVQYRASDVGTAAARNPWAIIVAVRTG